VLGYAEQTSVGDITFPIKKHQITSEDRQLEFFSQLFKQGYLLCGDIPIPSRKADVPFG
jgi:hypothetical protein